VWGKRIGHIWSRSCILKHVIDGNIEENRRDEKTRKKT
jgi:hypothetical protein